MRRGLALAALALLAGCGSSAEETSLRAALADVQQARDADAAVAEHLDDGRRDLAKVDAALDAVAPANGARVLVAIERARPGVQTSFVAASRALTVSGRGNGDGAAASLGAIAGVLPGLSLASVSVGDDGAWSAAFELATEPAATHASPALPPPGLFETQACTRLRAQIAKTDAETVEVEKLLGPVAALPAKRAALDAATKALPARRNALRNALPDVVFAFAGASPLLASGTLTWRGGVPTLHGRTALAAATLADRAGRERWNVEELASGSATLAKETK